MQFKTVPRLLSYKLNFKIGNTICSIMLLQNFMELSNIDVGYLRQCSIIPNVSVMWKTVIYVTQFAFLDILFYWIQSIVLADLQIK